MFVVLSFLLRALSALGGAASETSAMSIAMEEFPERLGLISVSLFLIFRIQIAIKQIFDIVSKTLNWTNRLTSTVKLTGNSPAQHLPSAAK